MTPSARSLCSNLNLFIFPVTVWKFTPMVIRLMLWIMYIHHSEDHNSGYWIYFGRRHCFLRNLNFGKNENICFPSLRNPFSKEIQDISKL